MSMALKSFLKCKILVLEVETGVGFSNLLTGSPGDSVTPAPENH